MILSVILLIFTVVSIGQSEKELRNNEEVDYTALVKIFLIYLLTLCMFFIIFVVALNKYLETFSTLIQLTLALFSILLVIQGTRLIMKRFINNFTTSPNIRKKLDGLFISGLTFAAVLIKIMFDLLS